MNQNQTLADTIFYNGKIVTIDPAFSLAEAVAVKDGKILAVGSDQEILKLAHGQTERIDLKKRTVLPGINDAHIHLSHAGLQLGKGLSRGEIIMRQDPWSDEEIHDAFRAVFDTCLRLGVTSVTDGEMGEKYDRERGGIAGTRALHVLSEMKRNGEIPIRVNLLLSFGSGHGDDNLELLKKGLEHSWMSTGFGDSTLRIAGVKFFADGVTGLKTCFNYEVCRDGSNGRLLISGDTEQERHDELVKMVCYAHQHGLQVGIHCCGDKAIDAVADAYIQAQKESPWDSRDYFIHGDLITPECIERIKEFSFGYSVFIPAIWEKIDALSDALGAEGIHRLYPIKSITEAGIPVTAHTDYPFTLTDWRLGMQCCVLRQMPGEKGILKPEECVSIEDAIRFYTINGAWQTHEENIKGSIEAGKLADFCVLDEDILSVDKNHLQDLPVVMTVVGGKILYHSTKTAQ